MDIGGDKKGRQQAVVRGGRSVGRFGVPSVSVVLVVVVSFFGSWGGRNHSRKSN